MEVFKDDPYFAGVFWWDWPTFLVNNPEGFCPYLKKTEKFLRGFYGEMRNAK